jgi:hypothetical protein
MRGTQEPFHPKSVLISRPSVPHLIKLYSNTQYIYLRSAQGTASGDYSLVHWSQFTAAFGKARDHASVQIKAGCFDQRCTQHTACIRTQIYQRKVRAHIYDYCIYVLLCMLVYGMPPLDSH